MDENTSRQILDDLLPSLEALDTKASALLQLLKDKGIATPEEITAHLDQAANGSNVRWLAARVRLEYLLSSAAKPQEEAAEKKAGKKEEAAEKKSTEPADTSEPASQASKEGEAKENQTNRDVRVSDAHIWIYRESEKEESRNIWSQSAIRRRKCGYKTKFGHAARQRKPATEREPDPGTKR